ncbi:MAG: MarR family winged helix-turn-helix transcriptional regulator [Mycobacteriaceae bacterium]
MVATDADPGIEVGAEELGVEFGRLMRLMDRTNTHSVTRRRDGLDKAAFVALFKLVEDGPQRSSCLAESTLNEPSTVSRHVAHLVELGLVERTADPDDGRATLLAATERGRQTAANILHRRTQNISMLLADWPIEDRRQFTHLLARFTTDFERHRPQFLAMADAIAAPEGDS